MEGEWESVCWMHRWRPGERGAWGGEGWLGERELGNVSGIITGWDKKSLPKHAHVRDAYSLDEAVSALSTGSHVPAIGGSLWRTPAARGGWPAWRLGPVAAEGTNSITSASKQHQTPHIVTTLTTTTGLCSHYSVDTCSPPTDFNHLEQSEFISQSWHATIIVLLHSCALSPMKLVWFLLIRRFPRSRL